MVKMTYLCCTYTILFIMIFILYYQAYLGVLAFLGPAAVVREVVPF